MIRLMMIAAAAAFAFTLPASPAAAQGSLSPFPQGEGPCPSAWNVKSTGQDAGMCRPSGSASKAYPNPIRDKCAEG